MRPYYATGLIRDIAEPLASSVGAEGALQLYAFSTEVYPAHSLAEIEHAPFGQYTFLDKVIEQCERRHIGIGWIVTDNIEDTGEAGNTDRFYSRLRSDAVQRVTVFPVRAPSGHPGLVVYALLFDPAFRTAYDNTLRQFVGSGSGVLRTEPLLMKPVNQDTVEVTSRDLAPLTRRGGPKIYDTGTPLKAEAEVRFHSRLDHIEIVDSSLRILDAKPSFGPSSLLEPTERQVAITPNRIRDLGPGRETAQVYHLSADLGEIHLKSSPVAWWRAAWGHPEEEAELPLTFAIDVPQQNFRLRQTFLNQWSASTIPNAQSTGKVYALDRLLTSINAGDTEIRVTSPLFFRVRYPAWPAVLWIALFALGLALLVGLALAIRRLLRRHTQRWTVRATTPEGQPIHAVLEDGFVLINAERVARIEGTDLVPIAPARLASGKPRSSVVSSEPVRLNTRRQLIDLTFTQASQSAAQTVSGTAPPHSSVHAPPSSSTPRASPPRTSTPPRRR